ncbi:hypothetical protein M8C13_01695 [Crossiella sp. SN42]|uniref:hypothetical protein n=1 Tax=Crossiella sp. SN42 TaxID=2944808 RepID=UPI00207D1D18|nr:hypothetical protein [Crossiella sp. SN42]MCO1574470.1 hypothetical protein [Crossiella sp. SN42]
MSGYRLTRFPLPGIFAFVALLWLAFAVVIGLVLAAIAVFGTVTGSVWDTAVQFTMWFAFGFTAWLTYTYLPVYVAHGITRREYAARVAGFVGGLAVLMAVLTAIGYLAEAGVYALADWPHVLAGERHFRSATEVPLVLLVQLLNFGAVSATGALLAAVSYRNHLFGVLLVLPVAAVAVGAANVVTGTGAGVFLGKFVQLGPASLAVGTPVCLALIALLLGGTWLLLRDADIRQ